MEKVQQTIVWHEFGHVFGYVLVDRVFKDYRKIAEIILVEVENQNPQIVPNRENLNSEDNDNEIIIVVKEILIFIMGAIFHVAKFKSNDEIHLRDFKDIFKNPQNNHGLSTNNLIGHAGSDFNKIEKFIEQGNCFDNNRKLDESLKVKKFTFYLHKLLKKHDIFTKLEPYIGDFDYRYNGKKTKGNDLYKNENNKVKKIISKKLVKEIKQLINEWFSTDIK